MIGEPSPSNWRMLSQTSPQQNGVSWINVNQQMWASSPLFSSTFDARSNVSRSPGFQATKMRYDHVERYAGDMYFVDFNPGKIRPKMNGKHYRSFLWWGSIWSATGKQRQDGDWNSSNCCSISSMTNTLDLICKAFNQPGQVWRSKEISLPWRMNYGSKSVMPSYLGLNSAWGFPLSKVSAFLS